MKASILDSITRSGVLTGHRTVVVGVSGGPDSVCLLHALSALRAELGLRIHVAHLDHRLRGVQSSEDASYVSRLADELGMTSTVESRDVTAYRTERHLSLEEAAREVRYSFFAQVVKLAGATAVAVGHTRDDNVETILMHIVRGTGTRGMRGLLPVTDLQTASGRVTVIRPLLEVTRQETAQYCAEHRLAPRTDESNRSLSLLRNRIRLELLPLMRTYNTQVDDALSRIARIATDEYDFLDQEARRVWDKVAGVESGVVILRKDAVLKLAPALKRQVLRLAVGEFVVDLKDIESGHVETLVEAIDGPSGRVFQLPGGLVFVIERDRCLLGRAGASLCPLPPLEGESPLNVPGQTVVSGWRITARVLPSERGRSASPVTSRPTELAFSACFDYDSIGCSLAVRPVLPGDRFEPLGLGASKKVSRFMMDGGVPLSWRKRVPIVVTPQQVAWVVGWRIDDRLRVTDETSKVLLIDFARE